MNDLKASALTAPPPHLGQSFPTQVSGHLFGKSKSSILGVFSQDVREGFTDRVSCAAETLPSETDHDQRLDAPAVALGMFEGALHLFAEQFRER
jgi:hypothetical protein